MLSPIREGISPALVGIVDLAQVLVGMILVQEDIERLGLEDITSLVLEDIAVIQEGISQVLEGKAPEDFNMGEFHSF